MRAYGNNWHDGVMAEIELGSTDAYIAMAWEERFPTEWNRTYDHGITGMAVWHTFRIDELCGEGKTLEEARTVANDTPWGPFDWTEEMLEADEELVRARVEWEEDRELERTLRARP